MINILKQNIEFLNLRGGPVPANIGDAEFTSRYARPASSPSVLKQRANKRDWLIRIVVKEGNSSFPIKQSSTKM